MKSMRILGLCLAAVFAISAVAVSSAAASTPEYKTCAKAAKVGKTYTGAYTDKNCSELNAKGEGKFERVAVKTPDKFKAKAAATTIYLYDPTTKTLKLKVICTKGKDEGEIFNSTEAKLKITYEGCEPLETELKGKCTTAGQAAGTIVTEPAIEKLAWVNSGETEVGVSVAAAAEGGPIEKMTCAGAETAELRGAMTGKIGPVNTVSKTQTLTFNASSVTGEPELLGTWSGATFTEGGLFTKLGGFAVYEHVPTGQQTVEPQKGGSVLIAG